MPEITSQRTQQHVPLPNFRILPRTFTHLSAYVHVYCRVHIIIPIFTMYMTETPRVLHFSAFNRELVDTLCSDETDTPMASSLHRVSTNSLIILTCSIYTFPQSTCSYPRRACAGGLRYLSCLFAVCLFVCLSGTT